MNPSLYVLHSDEFNKIKLAGMEITYNKIIIIFNAICCTLECSLCIP